MSSRALVKCTTLCFIPLRVYVPYACTVTFGVISNVDTELSDVEIARHLHSEIRLARIRQLGPSMVVKLAFY